jgi:AraC family transcriptional regulator
MNPSKLSNVIPIAQAEHKMTTATLSVPGFRVIEEVYKNNLELSWHSPAYAYLRYVLDGWYSEISDGAPNATWQKGSLRYIPPGTRQSYAYRAGTTCLLVEIEPATLERVTNMTESLQRPWEIRSIVGGWLAHRLYQEFRQCDKVGAISLEGILLELLAESARCATGYSPAGRVPDWLHAAREFLESDFLRPLSLSEVAGVAGVHRVHLAREFRRYFSTTVGEFLRNKRIEHACHLVSKTNDSLADVAMSCGFSDQSHLTATFRRQTGLTPGRFRQMHARRVATNFPIQN